MGEEEGCEEDDEHDHARHAGNVEGFLLGEVEDVLEEGVEDMRAISDEDGQEVDKAYAEVEDDEETDERGEPFEHAGEGCVRVRVAWLIVRANTLYAEPCALPIVRRIEECNSIIGTVRDEEDTAVWREVFKRSFQILKGVDWRIVDHDDLLSGLEARIREGGIIREVSHNHACRLEDHAHHGAEREAEGDEEESQEDVTHGASTIHGDLLPALPLL